MRRIGAFVVISALVAALAAPSPSAAFGLRLGPFHVGLPFFGFHHRFVHRHRVALAAPRHRHTAMADKALLRATKPARFAEPALLYPVVALPGLYDEIFWPAQSPPWPFGYGAIFRSAFAKSPAGENAQPCQQSDRTTMMLARLGAEIRLTATQQDLLQKLGQALGIASGYLAKACPKAVPAEPVARLQLMQSQIQTLSMAIDLVRPPLQQLQQSLDAQQKARFAAMPSDAAAAAECGAAPAATDWSVDDIDQSVHPDQNQQNALADLEQNFAGTAADLHAHCPNPLPPTPLARLEAIEGRLDASWRAALSMQVALAKFERALNDQQRNRFEAMNLTLAHQPVTGLLQWRAK
jgi:hypothetical protein